MYNNWAFKYRTMSNRFAAENLAAVLKTASWSKVVTAHKRAVDEVFKTVANLLGDRS